MVYSLPVRVYYQDTDAGGVVFHASYLNFLERARTEWLRHEFGLTHCELMEQFHVMFVLRALSLEYHKPAKLDDLLYVSAELRELGRSRVVVAQQVLREGQLLTDGVIDLVCVDTQSLTSVAIPEILKQQWQQQLGKD